MDSGRAGNNAHVCCMKLSEFFSVFFFQAEDGIRDHCVTGVQTCALPICRNRPYLHAEHGSIRTWVAALPERQRLAVFLRYYADLDYRAIGTVLGVEVGTVSATLSAAHTTLRRDRKSVV